MNVLKQIILIHAEVPNVKIHSVHSLVCVQMVILLTEIFKSVSNRLRDVEELAVLLDVTPEDHPQVLIVNVPKDIRYVVVFS